MASAEGPFEIPTCDLPLIANAAIATARFVTVKTAAGRCSQTGAGEDVTGVSLAAAAAAGDPVPVRVLGVAKIECGGTITIGARAKSDASGKAVAIVETGGSASQEVGGRILHTAASGDIQPLLVQPGQFQTSV